MAALMGHQGRAGWFMVHKLSTSVQPLLTSGKYGCCRFSSLRPKSSVLKYSESPFMICTKRTFRQKRLQGLSPVQEVSGSAKGFSHLWRPLGFTFLVSGTSFTACSIWQYETLRSVVQNVHKQVKSFYGKAGSFRHHVNVWWNNLGSGPQAVATIIGLNSIVFLLWRAPALTRILHTYFSCSPHSAAPCWSMFFSMFSHYSLFHIAANMYVLWSFAPSITNLLGREQFVAMYLTGGMVSAFASHFYKIARHSKIASIGASGAIMAVLGAVCSQYPNAQLSIAFVGEIYPHSFSASSGMKALILMDTLGVLMGWRLFDHAAHLGGMLFGIWYINYGHKLIWGNREPVIKAWHKLRGKPGSS